MSDSQAPPNVAEGLYRRLSLIRHVERKIVEVYPSDVMQTAVHLSIGQESVAAALCGHLTDQDLKVGSHRSHALYVASGGDLTGLFAELLGRATGCAGGRGGSMHLIDRARGLVGTTSIVGGCLPIAAGLAMAVRPPHVAVAFFGDGAVDQGVFAETLNFASLHRLPLVLVCENNRYSVYTSVVQRQVAGAAQVAKTFKAWAVEAPLDVASNVFALHNLMKKPLIFARCRYGPAVVECHTVRGLDHHGVRDDVAAGCRPLSESKLMEQYCPMKVARRAMDGALAERIDREAAEQVEAAYAAALAAPPAAAEVARG